MSDFMGRLEFQLVTAHARVARKRRLRRRATFGVSAALAISGTAYAAVELWNPQVGDERRGFPTVTVGDAPPQAQLDLVGALRRPATAADRGPLAQTALRLLAPDVAGVRTDYVRVLRAEGHEGVLIPVARFNVGKRAPANVPESLRPAFEEQRDGLCLFFADARDGGGLGCLTTEALDSGQIAATSGRTVYGLVPDDVATVEVELRNGESLTLEPTDNFYAHTEPPGTGARPIAQRTIWLDAAGRVVGEAQLGP